MIADPRSRRGKEWWRFFLLIITLILLCLPADALAAEKRDLAMPSAVNDPRAIFCLIVFILSYLFVMTEEQTHLRKSKPVMLGAGIIWLVIGIGAPGYGISHEQLKHAIFHDLDEYGSLMLFLFAAMTYIGALESCEVFKALRSWLVRKGLSYKQLFWVTGAIAFFLSAIADNLTTALVMGAVIMAVGANSPKFVAIAMVNVVSAANAGGAFSPFGDITTLMVWQSGNVAFFEFFKLFMPSVATFLVPAVIMGFFLPSDHPSAADERVVMKRGAKRAIGLFLLTITMAVCFEQFFGLPPFMGMMTGLSLLMFLAYYLRKTRKEGELNYEIFNTIKLVEWDTLLFFFRCHVQRRRTRLYRLSRSCLKDFIRPMGPDHGKCPAGCGLGHRGQYSDHVLGLEHASGNATLSMAVGDTHLWYRRQFAIHRLGRWGRFDGHCQRQIHLCRPSQMVPRPYPWLCRRYRDALFDQWELTPILKNNCNLDKTEYWPP